MILLRIWVIIGIIVFFILYIAIILAIIIYILRKLFSKTPKVVDENGHKLNAELVSATLGKYHVYRKKKALWPSRMLSLDEVWLRIPHTILFLHER